MPNLASVTKAFLLMSLDLYYSGFKSIGAEIGKLYSKFLDEHDSIENSNRKPPPEVKKDSKLDETTMVNSYSLRNLRKEFDGLKTNGGQEEHRKINREYLNRPLKASDRLKYFQNSNSELTRDVKRNERIDGSPHRITRTMKESSSETCLSQTNNSLNNNRSDGNDNSQSTSTISTTNRPALLTISTNCQDQIKSDAIASPTESQGSVSQIMQPKLDIATFNWFEAVEREEIPDFTPQINNSGNSNKFDTSSVASYSSNPASPQERVSPQSSHTNRSRRNSLNRFRSEFYRQSNEDLRSNTDKRSNRNNESKQSQNYHQSWRNAGGRNSPRNDPRNGYNKRGDYDRENSNNNGRHNEGSVSGSVSGAGSGNYNNNRRNLIRGGSVDGKGKDFNTRTRHDSFNRRNQENDNFEHFQSYNRKTYSRNKDNFMNNRTLPPRLQQKWQQQQQRAEYNDCDNPKRFNNRNNQSGNTNKGTIRLFYFDF